MCVWIKRYIEDYDHMAPKACKRPQKCCVWGGSGITKCYRYKSLSNQWITVIIVKIKAINH